MSEYDKFLEALAKNPDDTPLRLVFADWLDEQGEHEEADRHRKWPAAKDWFVRLCHEHNPPPEAPPDMDRVSPETLIERGEETIRDYLPVDRTDTPAAELRRLLAGGWDALKFGKLDDGDELEEWETSFEFCVFFGNNLGLCDAARENVHAFWKNLSIVIGIPLPPTIEQKSWFACSC